MTQTSVSPAPSARDSSDDGPMNAVRMSFGDHLEELRSSVIRALIGVVMATAGALACGNAITKIVYRPLWAVQTANGLQPNLQSLAPSDAFAAYLKMGVLAGLIASMPWVLYQIWTFVSAGLYAHERRFARRLTFASSGLFAVGVLFLYYIVLPVVLQFFISFNRAFDASDIAPTAFERVLLGGPVNEQAAKVVGNSAQLPVYEEDPRGAKPGEVWVNSQTSRLVIKRSEGHWSIPLEPGDTAPAVESQFAISSYISFVLMLALAFGIAFETPIVVCFLAWSGLVTTAAMAHGRRHVVLAMVTLAAILTPPDVISQLLLALPMYLLFEAGIRVARIVEHRRAT